MVDYSRIYDIIYALCAIGGREQKLFGPYHPLAHEAFRRSMASPDFPEIWFELPLAGDPWFDLHVLTARKSLDADMPFDPETTGGNPAVFSWFARQDISKVRQLALSYDVHSAGIDEPAVQLLVRTHTPETICSFLQAAENETAAEAYRSFEKRLPDGWFCCYAGVFPSRKDFNLRVECIPDRGLERAYAQDIALLERDLRQVGLCDFGETLLPRCQLLAQSPYPLEFQLDISPEGRALPTVSASVRFGASPDDPDMPSFDPDGPAGELMERIESWGLADDRWRLLPETAFAKRVTRNGKEMVFYCYPAFIKLRWRNGEPVDAKTYLIAGHQPE